jgi:DNA polymerase-3 subunit delta
MDSLTFLARHDKAKIQPVYVVHGDEDFLKRQVVQALRTLVLGEGADDFLLSAYAGDRVDYATVMDDLRTVPFFGPRRLILVENADAFVTQNRAALEKAVTQLPATGVLVLEVKTWTATTRLAKLIDDKATIVCKAPATARLTAWCVEWCQSRHGKQLTGPAAALLVALVGQEMGLLDQELQKLAVYIGKRARIGEEEVDKLVGRSQGENTWKIFDAIGAGDVRGALAILDRLLEQGEEPLKMLGAFSMQLRRLAQAGRLVQQGKSMPAALEEVGVPPYFVQGCVQQMKHLGRARTNRLYDWLLEINMDLRGESKLPPRTLLERLVIRLARKAETPIKDGNTRPTN